MTNVLRTMSTTTRLLMLALTAAALAVTGSLATATTASAQPRTPVNIGHSSISYAHCTNNYWVNTHQWAAVKCVHVRLYWENYTPTSDKTADDAIKAPPKARHFWGMP